MAGVTMKLDGRFKKRLRVVFANVKADVGVLEDRPHKLPVTANQARKRAWKKDKSLSPSVARVIGATASYAGGPIRRTRGKSISTIAEVSESLRKHTGINFYTRPLRLKNNQDLLKFTRNFVQLFMRGGASKKRVENLLQAVVRNPILRGDYGKNSAAGARAKGFNRFMIDTGQLFKNIKASVTGVRRV